MAQDILIIDDEADIRDLVSGILEDDGHRRRCHVNHFHAKRDAHVVWRQMEQTLPGTSAGQIEHGDDVARRNPAHGTDCPPDAHVCRGRHVTDQLETGRKLLELERNAKAAFNDFFPADRHPHHDGYRNRQQLQTEMPEGPEGAHR